MAIITYKTKTSPFCQFSRMGTVEDAKKSLAFIMGDDWYEITKEEESP